MNFLGNKFNILGLILLAIVVLSLIIPYKEGLEETQTPKNLEQQAKLEQQNDESNEFVDDIIAGTAGSNVITAGAGNDTITLGTGVENISGGDGNDTFITATNIANTDTIDGGAGTDTLTTTTTLSNPSILSSESFKMPR